MPDFDPAVEKELHAHVSGIPNAELGKMFGTPGYMVNGKLAVGIYKNGLIVKVGRDRVAELLKQDGFSAYEPQKGRVWRDWVLLTGNFAANKALYEEAVQYVLKETSS